MPNSIYSLSLSAYSPTSPCVKDITDGATASVVHSSGNIAIGVKERKK
jgi:hypothetical protein